MVERFEDAKRRLTLEAFDEAGGVVTKAAEKLGVGRSTLYRWLQEYGVKTEGESAESDSD